HPIGLKRTYHPGEPRRVSESAVNQDHSWAGCHERSPLGSSSTQFDDNEPPATSHDRVISPGSASPGVSCATSRDVPAARDFVLRSRVCAQFVRCWSYDIRDRPGAASGTTDAS